MPSLYINGPISFGFILVALFTLIWSIGIGVVSGFGYFLIAEGVFGTLISLAYLGLVITLTVNKRGY